jgi:glutamate carboxypeptidase
LDPASIKERLRPERGAGGKRGGSRAPERARAGVGPREHKKMNAQAENLLRWCESEQPWLRETIEALVQIESPSDNKAAVDRCGVELVSRLNAIGGRVEVIAQPERGDQVRAEFGNAHRHVLLLGHFDTVWSVGQIARMPVREERGRLYGPGVFDMKAGIGVAMLAMRALQQFGAFDRSPRVVMLWTTDEEIGSASSRELIEEEARRSSAVLVLEPSLPGGAAKTSRKGCGDFELTVHGISAHAGIDPGKGASAVHELARQIVAIEQLQNLERGVSVNVGLVSGGSRTNVVAERAHACIDVRAPTMMEAARVERALTSLKPEMNGTRLEVSGGFSRPPLERGEHVVSLYHTARNVASAFDVDLAEGGTGGGSDGNFTAALGVPTLDGLGPRGDGAHALHEHVELEDLPWRAAFLARLLARLAEVE